MNPQAPPDLASQEAARAELELRRRRREREAIERPLLDFVPVVTPRWSSPRHLRRLTDLFERIARGERVRALVSVPAQHGKTETLLHALAWLLRRKPWLRNAYASYAAKLSLAKSRLARDYAARAGVQLRHDAKAAGEWHTVEGGGLLATGVGGPLTGNPVDGVLLVDDPHKNREEAESEVQRNKVKTWWQSTAITRVHPGASALVVHNRWHEDDLIGWLRANDTEGDWEVIELQAVAEGDDPTDPRQPGEPLWPEFWSAQSLKLKRREVGEYDWASLYQQRPRPRGGTLFGDPRFFTDLPEGWTACFGLDFAYTKKTKSDWNVAVHLVEVAGRFYVINRHAMQARAPRFAKRLRALKSANPGARFAIYASGVERGVVDLMNDGTPDEAEDEGEGDDLSEALSGLDIEVFTARADKYVRAQKTAASWNAGRILLPAPGSPHHGPWVSAFISAIKGFTGEEGGKDDDADALVAAHDALAEGAQIPADDGFDQYLPTPTF